MRSLLLTALLGLPFLAPAPTRASLGNELEALETFDAAWSIIDRQHFDPNFNGVDWKAVRDELRPRAEAAKDREELRGVIRDMLGRLGQSHFALIPEEQLRTGAKGSESSPAGTAGFDLRWIDARPVVVGVDPAGPAEGAGVRPGWVLTEVDGKGVRQILEDVPKKSLLRPETVAAYGLVLAADGEVGTRVELGFEDDEDRPQHVSLERVERGAEPFDLPGLPTFFLSQRWTIDEYEDLSVGVLWFSNWFRPLLEDLDEALVEMRGCDGIVLDLRGNSGGDGSLTTTIAGHFFAEKDTLGAMRMRRGIREFGIRPRRRIGARSVEAFTGPLAILVDATTGSSSEVFTGGMQANGRARVFGQRTAGSALPATLTPLPNGDSLMHAVGEFTTGAGDVLEGAGVLPDEEVEPGRSDWRAGRDLALEAALEWIAVTAVR